MNEDLVVLYSGGADSTLLLNLAVSMNRKPLAVIIDYNQKHREELKLAKEYIEEHKIECVLIKIDGYDVNSALTGSGEKGLYKGVSIYNVPQRNTILLSFAAGIAESKNISEVWYGANYDDYENYFVDCWQEYVCRINKLFEISGSKPIKVYAPLLGMNKQMINSMLDIYNIDKNKIYSGYGEFN